MPAALLHSAIQFPALYSDPDKIFAFTLALTGQWFVSSVWSALSNASLVWVIVRQRSSSVTSTSFTRLLFLLAVADTVHSSMQNVNVYFVWQRATVGLLQCYHILAVFIVALNFSIVMMFVLSVDRLLSVVAPIW